MNTLKEKSRLQYELLVVYAGGAIFGSLQDLLHYNLSSMLLFLCYTVLAAVPVILYRFKLFKILYLILLPLLTTGFYLVFPLFRKESIDEFYSLFLKLIIKTFRDDLADFPAPYTYMVLGAAALLLLYVLILLKRFRVFPWLLTIAPAALLISTVWTGRVGGITIVLLSSCSLLSAVTYFYVRYRFPVAASRYKEALFFFQNLGFSAGICFLIFLGSQIEFRPEQEALIQRISRKSRDERSRERSSFIIIQNNDEFIDLSLDFVGSPETALEVLSPAPLYIMQDVYTYYDGKNWQRGISDSAEAIENSRSIKKFSGESRDMNLEITIRALKCKTLPYPPYLLEIDPAEESTKIEDGFSYSARSFTPQQSFWERVDNTTTEEELDKHFDMLDIVVSQGIRRLADEITENYSTPYGKVRAIEDYLRGELYYSTRPPKAPEGADLTEYFLFESHKGYCIHFASAMALLARAEGIPSRVVSGFVASRGSLRTDAEGRRLYTIPFSQAHAWTEVYLPPAGWIPVDATPRYLALYEQTYGGPSPEASGEIQNEPEKLNDNRLQPVLIIALALLLLLLVIPALPRFSERFKKKSPREQVRDQINRVEKLTRLIKIPYRNSMTLKEYRTLLAHKLKEDSAVLKFLMQLEYLIYTDKIEDSREVSVLKNLYPLCRKEIYPKAPLIPYLIRRYFNKI